MKRASLYLLPLLALYAWLVYADGYRALGQFPDALRRDEITYVTYARLLLEGSYAPPGSQFLWAGPGYPLLVAPLLWIGAPLVAIKMVNAVLLYGAALLLFASLRPYVSRRSALGVAWAFGLYWPMFGEIGFLMTEPLTIFLVAGSLYAGSRWLRTGSWWQLPACAVALAYLALTKVLFGYVLVFGIAGAFVLALVRRSAAWWRAALALGLGLALCTPYLAYTHRLTHRPFYWGTSGGMQLYWMSSPYENEYGDWINYVLQGMQDKTDNNPVMKHHREVVGRAMGYRGGFEREPYEKMILRLGVEQDDALFDAALHNIRAHPIKYMRNWFANVARLLFGVPFSYQAQSSGFLCYLFPNLLLVVFFGIGLTEFVRRRRLIPVEVAAVGGFVAIYLGGASLLSAYPRFFYVLAPMLFWWCAVLFCRPGTGRPVDGTVRLGE